MRAAIAFICAGFLTASLAGCMSAPGGGMGFAASGTGASFAEAPSTGKARKGKRRGAVSEIEPGTVLPYGRVARICGLNKRELGKQIGQYPEARPVHRLYDSNPGASGERSFFLTGFDDGCARQFTASIAMFGSVEMHELLRYGLPAKVQPYSDTDQAYEQVKSRVCRVPQKKPCGTAKLQRLQKDTVFVSIYERFGSNPHWSNLLLHRGDLVAQDKKSGS